MQSKAKTVKEYLEGLPVDRREIVARIRSEILRNLDPDYEEGMQYGMIGYYVPHRVYPKGYHCDPKQPLPFVCLASQKNHLSLYLMGIYEDGGDGAWFRNAWLAAGKKLDMGKCCVRFKRLEDVSLELIGEAVRRVPVSLHVERYERQIQRRIGDSVSGKGRKAKLKEKRVKPKSTGATRALGKRKAASRG